MACRTALGILTRRLLSSNQLQTSCASALLRIPSCKCVAIRRSSSESGTRQEWDSFGTWEDRIDEPIILEQSIKHGIPIPHISLKNVGKASVQGRRSCNEDRIIIHELEPNLLLFGLFDGHAGALAADFTVEHLCNHVLMNLQHEHNLEKVLSKTFVEINENLTTLLTRTNGK